MTLTPDFILGLIVGALVVIVIVIVFLAGADAGKKV